jgi:hypothetical protein
MAKGQREGLEKARRARQQGEKRGRAKRDMPPKEEPKAITVPGPTLQFQSLIKGSVDQLHSRVRQYVELCEKEPGAPTAMVLGTLMADLHSANDFLAKSWTWLNKYMDDEDSDPRTVTKLLDSLRKWTEVVRDSAIKIAELQAKTTTTILEEKKDTLSQYEIIEEEEEEEAPETEGTTLVGWNRAEEEEQDASILE